jgi:NAD+ synthase (glutamine-hydrolysing)
MRLALAQIDTTVGDVAGNTRRILDAIGRADAGGATLTLLPELAITGYPPEDLVSKPHFVEDNLMALEQVAAACGHLAFVGFVDRAGDELFNAVAACGNNRVLKVYRKRHLPNYGVFDEHRYFEPGAEEGLFEIASEMYALTVCEDIWVSDSIAEAVGLGARFVLNVSASPYYVGKGDEREAMLQARARDNGVWIAFCNAVGGQDELVFDGRSALVSPTGEVVARAASFEEDLLLVDFDPKGRLGAPERTEGTPGPVEEVYRALELGLADYIRKNGFTDVVVGLSGGIDSALTATVAADALGAGSVHGVLMPSRYSSEGSLTDARALAEALGIDAIELPIEGPFSATLDVLEAVFAGREADVTEENLQARVRGTLLMALSNKFGWLVLATGNKSELSVGYSTLYGDMVGGFAPLKDVLKTRVYELARWRNEQSAVIPQAVLDKAPSAELRPDQTDQDTLPPYDVLDAILQGYVEEDRSPETIAAAGFDLETVRRVCRMVDRAEYKRRQGPLGIKITHKALGRDRRMPITNRYGR